MTDLVETTVAEAAPSTISSRRRLLDRGAVTAEYALVTVAGLGVAGILWKIITDPQFQDLLWQLIQKIFQLILQYL